MIEIDNNVLNLVMKLHNIFMNKIISVFHNANHHMLCQLKQVVVIYVMTNVCMK